MFKKKYKVETIITSKNGSKYSLFHTCKMTKKQAEKLANSKRFGVMCPNKGYKWIVYNVTEI